MNLYELKEMTLELLKAENIDLKNKIQHLSNEIK